MESTLIADAAQGFQSDEAGTPQSPVAREVSDPNYSPTRDSVMSDDTVSASINDVEMILNHDTDFDLASPAAGIPREWPSGHVLATGATNEPLATTSQPCTPQQATSHLSEGTGTGESPISVVEPFKQALAFTPRRSARISTPVQSRKESITPTQTPMRQPSTAAEPTGDMMPLRLQSMPKKAGPTYAFSTPLPSPSIFLSRTSSPFRAVTTTVEQDSGGAATMSEYATGTNLLTETNVTGVPTTPSLGGANEEDVDMELDDTESSFNSSFTLNAQTQPHAPVQAADASALFASPIPPLLQPILSPVRLQSQDLASLAPIASEETTHPSLMKLASLSPTQISCLDRLTDEPTMHASNGVFKIVPISKDEILSKEDKEDKEDSAHGDSDDSEAGSMEMRIMTPTQRADRNAAVLTMLAIRSPARTPTRRRSNSHPTDSPKSEDTLAPLVTQPSPSRLPFPITLQPTTSARPTLGTPIANTTTPSRLPVPISTNRQHYPLGKSLFPSTEKTPFSPLSVIPTSASQLRQPSTLRGSSLGTTSKIPRPGSSKPYARSVSRLPKPKALSKTTVRSPPPLPAPPAPKVLQPPPPPVSPIKTRRGRAAANQQAQGTSLRHPTEKLPPDAVIFRPPPPRVWARPENVTQEDTMDTATDVRTQSPPPAPTPIITLPPPPKVRSNQLSKGSPPEPAQSAPPIPEFTATAPSLGIFPITSRTKGRGRTITRPMMMPLDPTSLRNLTNSNTLHNQQYVCSTVETQIVMREGKRPASPTTRVRTLLEKKKTEQDKGRGERAARRMAKQDAVEPSDIEGGKKKHPRAAGDDEDYGTPTKPQREPEEMDLDGRRIRGGKRVKWSTDLLQRFEMDANDFEGIRKRAELSKSATAAKRSLITRVLLDPLGNVAEADIPVPNLLHEQVVVTRIVYVDDLPPAERPKRAASTKPMAQDDVA